MRRARDRALSGGVSRDDAFRQTPMCVGLFLYISAYKFVNYRFTDEKLIKTPSAKEGVFAVGIII